jgi:hypothetical protein
VLVPDYDVLALARDDGRPMKDVRDFGKHGLPFAVFDHRVAMADLTEALARLVDVGCDVIWPGGRLEFSVMDDRMAGTQNLARKRIMASCFDNIMKHVRWKGMPKPLRARLAEFDEALDAEIQGGGFSCDFDSSSCLDRVVEVLREPSEDFVVEEIRKYLLPMAFGRRLALDLESHERSGDDPELSNISI